MTDALPMNEKAAHAVAPEDSSLHAEAYQRHLPNPLGGDTTIAVTSLWTGLGMLKAGLMTDGLTARVLSGGLSYGGVALGVGIGAGLLNYEFAKTKSTHLSDVGFFSGAGIGLAKAGLFNGAASGFDLFSAAGKGGAAGYVLLGGLGVASYELKKHL